MVFNYRMSDFRDRCTYPDLLKTTIPRFHGTWPALGSIQPSRRSIMPKNVGIQSHLKPDSVRRRIDDCDCCRLMITITPVPKESWFDLSQAVKIPSKMTDSEKTRLENAAETGTIREACAGGEGKHLPSPTGAVEYQQSYFFITCAGAVVRPVALGYFSVRWALRLFLISSSASCMKALKRFLHS